MSLGLNQRFLSLEATSMDRYKSARDFGMDHGLSVFWKARGIVNEEIQTTRFELSTEELHTVLANAREDTSGIAMLLVDSVNRQRRMERLFIVVIIILAVIAYKL
jgi:hypothetical protein